MSEHFDVVIVGGGIAGVSLAARLAGDLNVAVLEAEEHLGVHATGRSAALLVEAYGPPEIRRLTGMSRSFFEAPPAGFAEAGLCRPRGVLIYGDDAQMARLQREFELARGTHGVAWLDAAEALRCCPILRPGAVAAGYLEPYALDLDAAALLGGFASAARRAGAKVHKAFAVRGIERRAGRWLVLSDNARLTADMLVDAAGAWADHTAELAGAARLGLQPLRRSAATLPVPADIEALLPTLPFAAPADETFYCKPEARAIMVSLSDETPSDPCDAYPDDLDVAVALERFHEATIVPRARPTATWAGLRTFAPDRKPVVGFDPHLPGFFWCAGQGGYGIQTSPALSLLAAKLLRGDALEESEAALAAALSPGRIAATG